MEMTDKVFVALNIIYSILGTYLMLTQANVSGRPKYTTPGGWLPTWQGIGVVLIFLSNSNPWLLMLWWPVGIVVGGGLVLYLLTEIGILPANTL
jgi:hypothetical protein